MTDIIDKERRHYECQEHLFIVVLLAAVLAIVLTGGLGTTTKAAEQTSITREVYEAFQRGELQRFDAVVDRNVLLNSPGGFGMTGIDALKSWDSSTVPSYAHSFPSFWSTFALVVRIATPHKTENPLRRVSDPNGSKVAIDLYGECSFFEA